MAAARVVGLGASSERLTKMQIVQDEHHDLRRCILLFLYLSYPVNSAKFEGCGKSTEVMRYPRSGSQKGITSDPWPSRLSSEDRS